MENNISTSGIENCSLQLESIVSHLNDTSQSILHDFNLVKNSISNLKSWNGSDASEPDREIDKTVIPSFSIVTYKYIWKILLHHLDSLLDDSNLTYLNALIDNIGLLQEYVNALENTNNDLIDFIHQIELQLDVTYSGDIVIFFNSLKDNPAWQEWKQVSKEVTYKKQEDEIYQKYRSKNGKWDFVDYALDELGNKFLVSTYSSKYASYFKEKYPDSGASRDDDWCAEFVTYVLEKSGNKDAITPYLECTSGMNNARERSNMGNGVWHDANDPNYRPQRGDIFYTNGHTGIVVASDKDYIYTIEGNTSQNDGLYYVRDGLENNKGGFVNTRVRANDYVTLGYYTPNVQLNRSGMEQSLDTNFSSDYMQIKNSIQDKYEKLKIDGNHENKYSMG